MNEPTRTVNEPTHTQGESAQSVLLISDLAGYGKVALAAMIPVLSSLRLNVYNLPTALVSNTLDYGKFNILETTDYMRDTLQVWKELGFTFDAVFSGFLFSEEQSLLVADYCRACQEQGIPVYADPIMGDWGSLYNGVSEKNVIAMRHICSTSDVIMPNMTEAEFLCDTLIGKRTVTESETNQLVEGLCKLGSRNIIITSMDIEGQTATLISEEGNDSWDLIPYNELPVQLSGTGDIFSSLVLGNSLNGASLHTAVKCAMNTIECLLEQSLDTPDRFHGVPVELYLNEIQMSLESVTDALSPRDTTTTDDR